MATSLTRTIGIETPEVSVLMPVRDGARFLPQTWNTVRRSRGVRFEVLVVDDGSGDETPVLLEAWAREDHRLRWIRTEPGGIVNALNLGLSAARAPYVARLDADDLVHPDRLSRQYAAATGHGWMVVGSAVRCFPNHRITAGLRRYEDWQNGLRDPSDLFRERFVESPFVHPAVLMHRETVLRLGGYRSMGWPEDYDLWLRLFAAALPMGKVPETLTYWRDHAARLTRTAPDCTAAAITECKAAHLCSGPLAHCDRVFIAGTGDDAKRLARALARRGRPASGFLDINPRRIGQRIADVPVVTIEAVRSSLGPGALVLVAIGEAGRRDGLRRYFVRHGLHEPDEFLFVA